MVNDQTEITTGSLLISKLKEKPKAYETDEVNTIIKYTYYLKY
jgi:hypothetical protein